jgi:hypothetical protein
MPVRLVRGLLRIRPGTLSTPSDPAPPPNNRVHPESCQPELLLGLALAGLPVAPPLARWPFSVGGRKIVAKQQQRLAFERGPR